MSLPKYAQVAASIRTQIAEGTLQPGQCAPSGAALARATAYSVLTCRKALQALVEDGVLVPGHSRSGRPRIPGPASTRDRQAIADARRALSTALAAHRRASGLSQADLAATTGVSVTTIEHAETGRLWQSRRFWEGADRALDANGELLRKHDAYRAVAVPLAATAVGCSPAKELAPVPLTCITITWGDGTTTTVHPPAGVGTCHMEISEIRETSP